MNSTICSSVTSAIDADAANLPSRSTVTRSAIVRTAARSCEMKMTLEPWATTSRMRSNRNCSSSSGRKTVGSSSTSTDVVAPVRWRYSRSSSAARAIATSAWPTGGSSLTIVRGSIVTPYDSSIVRAFAASARQLTRKREYSWRAAAPTRFSSTVSGRRQAEILVDEAEADVVEPARRHRQRDRLAADHERSAGLGLVHAGEHLDQRGLATAVLAEQGVDLSVGHGEIHAVECPSCPELLGDVRRAREQTPSGQVRACTALMQCCRSRGRSSPAGSRHRTRLRPPRPSRRRSRSSTDGTERRPRRMG